MNELKEFILRRISHAEKIVFNTKLKYGDNPGQTHTYHGGWDLGYWQGKLSSYETILDEIEEIEGKLFTK